MAAADKARAEGKLDEAAGLYAGLARRFPSDAGLLILSGNMLKDAKRYSEARQSYTAAIAKAPDDADAHLQLGHLARLEGNLEQADASYRRSAALDPNRPDAANEVRALERVLLNSLTVHRFDPRSITLVSSEPAGLLFERMKVAFANKPA